MARSDYSVPARLLVLIAASAGCALYLVAQGGSNTTAAALTAAAARVHVADFILNVTGYLLRCTIGVLPFAVFIGAAYVVSTRRAELNRRSWFSLGALMFVSILLWAMLTRLSTSVVARAPEQAIVGPVHSGEAVVSNDGRHVILPDPTKPEGSAVGQDWQRNLATTMTQSIKSGQEQVMLIFSRQGCPWCERQLPVIHRAIESRAQEIAGLGPAIADKGHEVNADSDGVAAGAASVVGTTGGRDLLQAPLRAFVIDAGEFPFWAQQFQIKAFPTSIFLGKPGARPLVAQGFLNDEQLDEILQMAATAQPPTQALGDEPVPVRSRRRKRRGLFK